MTGSKVNIYFAEMAARVEYGNCGSRALTILIIITIIIIQVMIVIVVIIFRALLVPAAAAGPALSPWRRFGLPPRALVLLLLLLLLCQHAGAPTACGKYGSPCRQLSGGFVGKSPRALPAASFQKLDMEEWAQALGDLSFQRAC